MFHFDEILGVCDWSRQSKTHCYWQSLVSFMSDMNSSYPRMVTIFCCTVQVVQRLDLPVLCTTYMIHAIKARPSYKVPFHVGTPCYLIIYTETARLSVWRPWKYWRRWRQAPTSPVNTKAVTLTNLPLQSTHIHKDYYLTDIRKPYDCMGASVVIIKHKVIRWCSAIQQIMKIHKPYA